MNSMSGPGKAHRQPMLSTTILAGNVHCSSCVSHIKEVVERSSVSYAIVCTNVSIVSGEIQILHEEQLPVQVVCREISDAAFEVYSATTVDEHDRVVSELTFTQNNDGLVDETAERVRTSSHLSPGSRIASWVSSTPLRNKRKRRHVENCLACQNKEKHELLEPVTPTKEKHDLTPSCAKSNPTPLTSSTTRSLVRALDQAWDSPSPCARPSSRSETLVSPPQKWSAEMSISGMTCSACTNSVNDALIALDAVESVHVTLMTNSVTVVFSGEKDYEVILKDAIEDVGFEVTETQTTSCISQDLPRKFRLQQRFFSIDPNKTESGKSVATVTRAKSDLLQARFSITGMTCSSCTSSVTDILTALDFVESAIVTLMTNSAEVAFTGRDNVDAIVTAVEDMGFECALEPSSLTPMKACLSTPVGEDEVELPTCRSIQIKIDGFYCPNCPGRVLGQLDIYGDTIHVDKNPTLADPIISLSYIPDVEHKITAREMIRTIQLADEEGRFKASIHTPPTVEEKSRQVQRAERQRLLWKLLSSVIVVIPTFIIGVVCMSLLPSSNSTRQFFMQPMWAGQVPRADWALFFLATPVYFFVADVFHKRAIKEIRALWRPKSRVPIARRFIKFGSMNMLVSAGTTIAYIASLGVLIMTATLPSLSMDTTQIDTSSSMYFDTVVFLTFFILIGRYLEAYSRGKAGDAVSMLGNLRPDDAIVCESDGQQSVVPTDQLEIGDAILVRYGESPAGDGVLLDCEGRFDESSLTGESRPVRKMQGEKVFIGTINLSGPVRIKVTDIGGTSMLDQIIAVVREGQVRRAPVEQIAELITGYFVPVITAFAILTFVVWISLGYSGALDPRYLGNQQGGWAYWSLEFAIAVFVVACPCGIGLAAPTALFVGGGLAAKHGILARGGGQAFQDAGKLDAIVFDKTGTLTEGGDLKVTDLEYLGNEADKALMMAITQRLETASSHPVAAAIVSAVSTKGQEAALASLEVLSLEEIPGNGIEGTFRTADGTWTARIGSRRFISGLAPIGLDSPHAEQGIKFYEQQAKTVALLAAQFAPADGRSPAPYQLLSIFAVEDAIRPSAAPAIEALIRRGLDVYMVSGDNPTTAHSVATRVGIKPENVFAGVLPTEKAATIEMLREKLSSNKQNATSSPVGSPLKRVVIDQGTIREKPKAQSNGIDIEAQVRRASSS